MFKWDQIRIALIKKNMVVLHFGRSKAQCLRNWLNNKNWVIALLIWDHFGYEKQHLKWIVIVIMNCNTFDYVFRQNKRFNWRHPKLRRQLKELNTTRGVTHHSKKNTKRRRRICWVQCMCECYVNDFILINAIISEIEKEKSVWNECPKATKNNF